MPRKKHAVYNTTTPRGVQYDNTTPKDHVTDKHYGLKHFMGQLTYGFSHESIQRPKRPG
jgi:hypothetical protein